MTVTYLRADEHDPARPHLMGSCGRPIPGNDVRLLDTQLQEVPPGEIGELCVRGPLVMSGYLNRPEETAKTLAGDWLHTLATWRAATRPATCIWSTGPRT